MSDQNMQVLTEEVERDLLDLIIQHLRSHEMDTAQAKALAKEFLTLLPMQDKQDLLNKLYSFSQKHTDTKGIYLKFVKPHEEEDRQRKLAAMSEHIKNGNIEHALNVAREGTTNG